MVNKFCIGIFILLIISMTFISAPPVSNCGTLNTADTIYTLQNNITTNGTCFTISANNITLDMNGYNITGDEDLTDYGVYINTQSNSTIKNGGIYNFGNGIYFSSSSNNNVTNMIINLNHNGIYYYLNSDNNIASDITADLNNQAIFSLMSNNINMTNINADSNLKGIQLFMSSNNIIKESTFSSNTYGIHQQLNSDNNIIDSTLFFKNADALFLDYGNPTLNNNIFQDNAIEKSSFKTNSQKGTTVNRIDFNLTMKYPNGTICPSCSYKINLYPDEASLTNSSSNELISGNFTPTRTGIYSLKFNITDSNGNSEIRKRVYLINVTKSDSINYYFSENLATHGQHTTYGSNTDAGSLISNLPTSEEDTYCAVNIGFSVDELPSYLFGSYEQINYSMWYIGRTSGSTGIQQIGDFSTSFSPNITADSQVKIFESFNFIVDWTVDYFWNWYFLVVKLKGTNVHIYSNATDPSYINITYSYPDTPAIKEITNEDIKILSATMASNTSTTANLTLEGEGITNISIQMPSSFNSYYVKYDDISCLTNPNCTINSQLNGIINLSLTLNSEHLLFIKQNLVCQMNLNENNGSTAHDTSGNDNHGTITGATWDNDGILVTLTEGVDYTLNKVIGLFTITNNEYSWAYLNANYSWEGTTNDIGDLADAVTNIGSVTGWFDIFIVIGAMIVLILLTVIIITAIRGSGLVEGGA